jgi:WD40 repeat protein
LATAGGGSHYGLTLWPLNDRFPRFLGGDGSGRYSVHFSPDGKRTFSSSEMTDGTDVVWSLPLSGGAGLAPEEHFRTKNMWVKAVDPQNRFIVVGAGLAFHKVPLDGSPPTVLDGALRSQSISLDPDGRYLAAAFADKLQVFDLEKDERMDLEPPGQAGVDAFEFDAAGHLLVTRGGAVSRWDPESRTTEVLVGEGVHYASPVCDGRRLYIMTGGDHETAERWVLDLEDGSRTAIPEAHRTGCSVAWDAACTIMASGHDDGEVRVGPFLGEETHLLLGRQLDHTRVQVSPDGKWIAARASHDGAVALWPVPDLSKPPLHTLPHDELLAKLEALTNLRAVHDESSHTGYRIEPDFSAYRGWADVPDW